MRSALALALLPLQALAQPYVEAGIGAQLGGCIYRWRVEVEPDANPGTCSRSPLAVVAVGWQISDRWRVQWEHWSAPLDSRDRGAEMLTVRYRFTFQKP